MPIDNDVSFQSVADGWIQTYTGGRYYFHSPALDSINPLDISHSLSMICRYNGHVRKFYSVAEHCYLMSRYAFDAGYGMAVAQAALLHDAAEAYVGDVTTPLKRLMGDEYEVIERKANIVISERFGVSYYEDDIHSQRIRRDVKELDRRIIFNEMAALSSLTPDWLPDDLIPLEESMVTIRCWDPSEAENHYIQWMQFLFKDLEY